jgi:hypothetical protein
VTRKYEGAVIKGKMRPEAFAAREVQKRYGIDIPSTEFRLPD